MNINSLSDKSVSATTHGAKKPNERVAAPAADQAQASEGSAASVEVKLSPVTQTMTHNVARSATDVFNADKVNSVRTAIANGSYSVNAEAIADKLIANAREMLSVGASAGSATQGGNALK